MRAIKRISLLLLLCILLAALYVYYTLHASLPVVKGTIDLPTLQQPVQVILDDFGNPTITAHSKLDVFRALGFLTARERLFQMDLIRRKSAGRLSEVFGDAAVGIDREQRFLQLERAAQAIIANLPTDQLHVLKAYIAHKHGVQTWHQTWCQVLSFA